MGYGCRCRNRGVAAAGWGVVRARSEEEKSNTLMPLPKRLSMLIYTI